MADVEYDFERAKREVQENYKAETGEELPDHVVDNIDLLQQSGASIDGMADQFDYGREAAKGNSKPKIAAALVVATVVAGGLGFGAGTALAGSFGLAVVAFVCAAFGFAVGVLLS